MTDSLYDNTRIAKGGTPLPHPLPRVRKHERIHHHINTYDDWHRLKTATGEFNSFDGNKSANYQLEMGYDNLYNITSKKMTMTQTNLQFAGKLSAGHEFNYNYSNDNPMQLASVETKQYNVDGEVSDVDAKLSDNKRTQNYEFDANGNMTSVSVAPKEQQNSEVAEQKDVLKSFLWDEENRLLAVNNNGSVSCYFYDAAGERTVKLTSETEMVHVNGKKVGGNDAVTKFIAYVSPYFVVSNGGAYTKHIYAANQRIASKLGNEDGFGADPRRVEQAGGKKISDIQKDNIGARYKELGFTYTAPEKEKVEKDSTMDSEAEEKLIFFYHPDHLGSTSYVTDADGNIAQHIEYIPYGEVFVEERNSQFSTNYLFNAKELDNETGLYYYGARYLDPTGAMWLSVDPVFHAGTSPYAYCLGNPVKMVDPDGENEYEVDPQGYVKEVNNTSEKHTLYAVDKDGNRTGSKINVKNKSILDDLTKVRTDYKGYDADGKNEKKGHYAYSKSKESMNLFVFLSDASSEAEWKLMKYKDGNYGIFTTHQKNAVSLHKGKYSLFDVLFDVHSHPGSGKYGTMGGSGYDNDRRLYGDKLYISDDWETWYYANIHDVQKQLEFPCYFVYHRKSQSLFQYTPWVGSINLGKVLNRNLMPNINKHKSSLSTK